MRRDAARAKMEQSKRLLVQVKSDIEHLANKVHHLKAVRILNFIYLQFLESYWPLVSAIYLMTKWIKNFKIKINLSKKVYSIMS